MKGSKRAIVSGSTSGIGKAVALALCREGYAITQISRNANKLEEVNLDLNNIRQDDHYYLQIDFEYPEQISKILEDKHMFRSDKLVLVNNVGGPLPKATLECSLHDFQSVFNKYLLSFHQITTFFVSQMKLNEWGRIVNVLGTTVISPIPGLGLSVIKSATANWTKTLSIELGKYGITVNNVLPGPTNTKELAEIVKFFSAKENKSPDVYLDEVLKKMPLRRIAEPEEIADGVAFLSSEKASFITGTNLRIDGGYTQCL